MVLEIAFPPASLDPKVTHTAWFVGHEAINRYRCDNVAIMNLRYKLSETEGKDKIKLAKIEVESFFHNRMGHDKMVTAVFDVMNGDQVVGSTSIRLKVEETDARKRAFVLTVPRNQLLKETTKLRITVRAVDG